MLVRAASRLLLAVNYYFIVLDIIIMYNVERRHSMDERTIEIQFYYYTRVLLKGFKYNIQAKLIVEAGAPVTGYSAEYVWNMMEQQQAMQAPWIPGREEMVVNAKQNKIPIRKFRVLSKVTQRDYYKILEASKNPRNMPSQETRMTDIERQEALKFINYVRTALVPVTNGTII